MILPEFTVPSYQNRPLGSIQSCINLYPEKVGDGYHLVGTSGLYPIGTVTNNEACRGALAVIYLGAHRLYSVHGDKVYRVYSGGTKTEIGTINVGSGRVSMAYSSTQIVIVDGFDGFIVNLATDVVTTIVDVDFPASPGSVTFQDSRFIVNNIGTGDFFISALDNGSSWDGLDYAEAEGFPDNLQAVVSNGTNLFLIGAASTEIWYNTRNPLFTYERISGAGFQVGTTARHSVASLNGTIFFLGSSNAGRGSVWMVNGTNPTRVSTPTVEESINAWQYGVVFGFCFSENGHQFYQVTNTTTAETWVFDMVEGLWHKRTSGALGYHRAAVICNAFQDVVPTTSGLYAFDTENGSIYTLPIGYSQDNGATITRTRDFGPVRSGIHRIIHHQIRIELDIKHDSSASFTLAPTLSWTDDGGKTFSTARTLTKAITSGTTAQRTMLQADRLGSSYERTYRLTFAGPAARILLKSCNLELSEGWT